jgi:hypothetical protein
MEENLGRKKNTKGMRISSQIYPVDIDRPKATEECGIFKLFW